MKLTNPYSGIDFVDPSWIKSNFHVHAFDDSAATDYGVSTVLKRYRDAGYGAVAILTQGEFVRSRDIGNALGICAIEGMEYIEHDGILCVGIDSALTGDPQYIVDEVARQGGFTVVAHPHWESEPGLPLAMSVEIRRRLTGYLGVEIINPAIFRGFRGSGLAVDVWDEILTAGTLVWGFGNDDFHNWYDMDRAWNMIASSPDQENIRKAVEVGRFYASTGLQLDEVSFDEHAGRLTVQASGGRTAVGALRYRFIGAGGEVLQEDVGRFATYTFRGDELYIRVHVAAEHGAMLWTQPIYDRDRIAPWPTTG
jgi:hypothetical protein